MRAFAHGSFWRMHDSGDSKEEADEADEEDLELAVEGGDDAG